MSTLVLVDVPDFASDPFRVRWMHSANFASVDTGDVTICLKSAAQADSLIRAAVAAKDLLIAATAEAVKA